MKRLLVRVDDDLHRRLRLMSVEVGESLQQLAVRLLQEELRQYERAAHRSRRGRQLTRGDVAAIRRGLDDIRAGRVLPWEELRRELAR